MPATGDAGALGDREANRSSSLACDLQLSQAIFLCVNNALRKLVETGELTED